MTYKEDDNQTIDKQAAYHLIIISKMTLDILKIYDTGKDEYEIEEMHYWKQPC